MRESARAPRVEIFDGPEELYGAAADRFVEVAAEATRAAGQFSVALAGGSTPRGVYELLAAPGRRGLVDWGRCHVFFGDERAVPPDHPESNYRMASEALLARVPVPSRNVHRMRGEGDAVANARLYEDELRTYFGEGPAPAFDLVLLGMGEDGHTASLFPHTPALRERAAWVAANPVERLGAFRITLTPTAINGARHVLFVVAGRGKAEALTEVLRGEYDPERLPAQLVDPPGGPVVWLVDREAASGL